MKFNTLLNKAETILSGKRASMPRQHKKAVLQECLGVNGRMAGDLVTIASLANPVTEKPSATKKMAPIATPAHKWALVNKETGEVVDTFPTRSKAREAKTNETKVVKTA